MIILNIYTQNATKIVHYKQENIEQKTDSKKSVKFADPTTEKKEPSISDDVDDDLDDDVVIVNY